MMGSFLTRGLVMVFGYAYPAYECYKTVERNKPEIEQLRFWCQYWILVAMLTVFERVGDTFVSWVPMYSEAKLAFFIYLWYPKTKGTTYVYDSFFRPYVAKHETEIDRNLLKLRTRAGDIAVLYWHKAATYGQTRVFEILQYVASQSASRPQPSQQQQSAGARQPPNARIRQPAATTQQQPMQPSRTSSTGATQQQQEPPQDTAVPPPKPPASQPAASASASNAQTTTDVLPASSESTTQSSHSEAEAMQIEPESSATKEKANPPTEKETVMEEAIRVTRGRLRRTRAATNR